MKAYGGRYINRFHFLPRHQLEVSGQLNAPVALPPGERVRVTLRIGRRWVGPGTGLDYVKRRKILSHRDSNSVSSAVQPVASRYTE
jgi:hypothetical protein